MDQSVGGPRTWSVVGIHGPGVSVFGLPAKQSTVTIGTGPYVYIEIANHGKWHGSQVPLESHIFF